MRLLDLAIAGAEKVFGNLFDKVELFAPEICLGVSLVTGAGAVISSGVISGSEKARKASRRLQDDLHEAKTERVTTDDGTVVEKPVVPQNKAVAAAYGKYYGTMLAMHWPTILLMTLSGSSSVCCYKIQNDRIAAWSLAYDGLLSYTRAYEARNKLLNGEESHELCQNGWHEEEGKKVKNTGSEIVDNGGSTWTDVVIRFRRSTSHRFTGRASIDVLNVQNAEQFINDKIAMTGNAILNDLYDELGMKRTPEGMFLGWTRTAGYVSLHMEENNKNVYNGHPYSEIVLLPEVQGNVYTMLKEQEAKQAA